MGGYPVCGPYAFRPDRWLIRSSLEIDMALLLRRRGGKTGSGLAGLSPGESAPVVLGWVLDRIPANRVYAACSSCSLRWVSTFIRPEPIPARVPTNLLGTAVSVPRNIARNSSMLGSSLSVLTPS